MWVCLHAEFERDPAGMIAARVAQLRALGSELGLDPSSRSRFGGSTPAEKDPYFD
jgi:phage terminase small subunit